MITNIYLRNFKAFQEAEIPPCQLNILTGFNGMGKSTFLQSLLLLRQSFLQKTLLDKGLLLNGSYIEIGKGKDALSMYGTDEGIITFEVEWDEKLELLGEFQSQDEFDLLPTKKIQLSDSKAVFEQSLFKDNCQFLSAERISPKDFFSASAYYVEQIHTLGNHGEFTTHFIAKNQRKDIPIKALAHPKANSYALLAQLDAWLGEIAPNIRVNSVLYDEFEIARLSYKFEVGEDLTEDMKPTNVGFGLTYVLPVVTAVLFAQPGDLLIIENPESHLHPQGQARLGKLFAQAAENGVQLFIETHSDHVLNGVRVATKQKIISPENVGLFFFVRDFESDEHKTEIIQPFIDENGRIDEWPSGFFDEWEHQLDELLK
jgi:predicted ATPase